VCVCVCVCVCVSLGQNKCSNEKLVDQNSETMLPLLPYKHACGYQQHQLQTV